jgi:hypothetical protein
MAVLMVSGATVRLAFGLIGYGWGGDKDTSNPWRFLGAPGPLRNERPRRAAAVM